MKENLYKVLFIIFTIISLAFLIVIVGALWVSALNNGILLTLLLSPFLIYATGMVYVVAKDEFEFIKAHVLQ